MSKQRLIVYYYQWIATCIAVFIFMQAFSQHNPKTTTSTNNNNIQKPLTTPIHIIPTSTPNPQLTVWYAQNKHLFMDTAPEWAHVSCAPTCLMLDIGANVGIFAHGLLQRFPQAHVLSFEPIPQYAHFIREHPLSTERLRVENYALSSEPLPTNNTLLMDKENLGWNTLHTSAQVIECVPCMRAINVVSVSLDWYEDHHPQLLHTVTFIKIDTEGYEFSVLQGMHHFLSSRRAQLPVLVIEVAWGPHRHPHWQEEVAEFEWLISLGYSRPNYKVPSTQDVWFIPARTTI